MHMGRGQIPTHERSKARAGLVALVPALNEAGRIGKVLEVLRQVTCIDEIVVIDDGSVDHMLEEVQQAARVDPRLSIISNETNLGKGQSLFKAWRSTRADYILMLDADLINLAPQKVLDLVLPVLDGECDMTMGLFKGGNWKTDLSHWTTPWLTGQRCLRADLFACVSENAARGYGFETALTVAARQCRWTVRKVFLRGVSHPPNENHRGFWRGAFNRARMYGQIVRAALITYRAPENRVGDRPDNRVF
jgi:polyisoprenyl-phosphate glycosyltransferase